VDFGSSGYTVLIDVGSLAPLPPNGVTTIEGLTGEITTSGCSARLGTARFAGDNPRVVHVNDGRRDARHGQNDFRRELRRLTGSVQVTTVTTGPISIRTVITVLLDTGSYARSATTDGRHGGVKRWDHSVLLFVAVGNLLAGR